MGSTTALQQSLLKVPTSVDVTLGNTAEGPLYLLDHMWHRNFGVLLKDDSHQAIATDIVHTLQGETEAIKTHRESGLITDSQKCSQMNPLPSSPACVTHT